MNAMKTGWMSGVVLGCLVVGCGSVHDLQDRSTQGGEQRSDRTAVDDDDDEEGDDADEQVALDQVPEAVRKAAEAAVPGFVLKSAEKETEHGVELYSLEGTAGGEAVEVEVSAASDHRVLEIERGEDEEDD